MARRSLEDREIRNLNRYSGGSYTITLPIEHIRELRWQEGQKLTVEHDSRNNRLIIKDWQSPHQRRKKR